MTLKIMKTLLDYLQVLIWPIGIFGTLFYFRKTLRSIFENPKGIKIKLPIGDIEVEIPTTPVLATPEKNHIDIDKNDEPKTIDTTDYWLINVINLIDKDDIKGAEEAFKKYADSERSPSELYKSKSYYLEFMFTEGNQKDLIFELEKHLDDAKNDDEKIVAIVAYIRTLKVTKQFQKAIDLLSNFIKSTSSQDLKSIAIGQLSECYLSNKEPIKAKKLIMEMLCIITENIPTSLLYINLSKVEESLGNKKLAALCLDKALEFNPADQEILFDSAYKLSEADLRGIAISNYSTLISINKKHSSAINNLAVCAEKEKLNIIATKYYNDSVKLDNTLSMVNQGFLLLNAGFSEHAENIAKEVLKHDTPHQNVHNLITSIHEKKEKQLQEWNDKQSKALVYQKKMRDFISAYTRKPTKEINNSCWKMDSGITLQFVLSDSHIDIKWTEEITDSTSKYECSISGKITNSSFEGELFKFAFPKPEGTILGPKHKTILFNAYGYLNKSEETLTIVDTSFQENADLVLKRIDV